MPTTYEKSVDLQEVAESIIASIPDHEHLKGIKIAYLKRFGPWNSAGMIKYGEARKTSPREAYLTGYKLVLTVNGEIWPMLSEDKQRALVDHEFCHIVYDGERDEHYIVGHDLEEFVAVVQRHGIWTKGVAAVVNAAQSHLVDQVELPLAEAAPATEEPEPDAEVEPESQPEIIDLLGGLEPAECGPTFTRADPFSMPPDPDPTKVYARDPIDGLVIAYAPSIALLLANKDKLGDVLYGHEHLDTQSNEEIPKEDATHESTDQAVELDTATITA